MDIDFDGVYRPYWEHTIYIPNAVYKADHAKQIAEECGGCTVYYAVGGNWVEPNGNLIAEPVTIVQALTRLAAAPKSFYAMHRELRSAGEQAVLITRRQLDANL